MTTTRTLIKGTVVVAALVAGDMGLSFLDPNIPGPFRIFSPAVFSHEELERCAAWSEYNNEMARKGANAQQVAMEMELEGDFGSILEMAAAYDKRFHIPTIYSQWRDEAPAICLKFKMSWTKIDYPPHGALPGYHITRSTGGSAAIVKDGDPEPVFGCMGGYHDTGARAQPDGSGGCQPD